MVWPEVSTLQGLTVAQLKAWLQMAFLPTHGVKSVLVIRLNAFIMNFEPKHDAASTSESKSLKRDAAQLLLGPKQAEQEAGRCTSQKTAESSSSGLLGVASERPEPSPPGPSQPLSPVPEAYSEALSAVGEVGLKDADLTSAVAALFPAAIDQQPTDQQPTDQQRQWRQFGFV
jgi:hypothetical protein